MLIQQLLQLNLLLNLPICVYDDAFKRGLPLINTSRF